ncbi:hypothetical protein J6590_016775 [Homalodisca vitripennis]|nr:hypothetical protein J6590_016775 [Homalodisca vitripennis]
MRELDGGKLHRSSLYYETDIGAVIFCDASFLMLVAVSSSGVSEAAGETAPLIRKQTNLEMSSDLREQLKSTLLQLLNKRVEFLQRDFSRSTNKL